MRSSRRILIVPAVALLVASAFAAVRSFERRDAPGQAMSAAAHEWVGALNETQKRTAVLPFDSEKRVGWHFVPLDSRKGLPLKEMTADQRKLAHGLLSTALSEAGYDKATTIMSLEKLLTVLEGAGRRWPRDHELYYFTLFGEPSDAGRWGLSVEGHHLSLNFVVENGRVVASTPQFLGANPGEIKTAAAGFEAGTRVLGREEQLAFDLLASLDAGRRAKAVTAEKAPQEIRAAGEAKPPAEPAAGLAASEMTEAQKKMLRELIGVYAGAMPGPVAAERLATVEGDRLGEVRFAWLGADKPGVGHAYRVQGPTFLIEFVNTQPDAQGNPANHIHSVWRDLKNDFAAE